MAKGKNKNQLENIVRSEETQLSGRSKQYTHTPFLSFHKSFQHDKIAIEQIKKTFRSQQSHQKIHSNPQKYFKNKTLKDTNPHQDQNFGSNNNKSQQSHYQVKQKIEEKQEYFSINSYKQHSSKLSSLNQKILNTNGNIKSLVKYWYSQQVKQWLKVIGFQWYCQNFQKQHIEGKHLFSLTQEELKNDLGIKAYGRRIDFKRELKFLKNYYISGKYLKKKKAPKEKKKDNGPIMNFINRKRRPEDFISRNLDQVIKEDLDQNNSSFQIIKKQVYEQQYNRVSQQEQSCLADNEYSSYDHSYNSNKISLYQSISQMGKLNISEMDTSKKGQWSQMYEQALDQKTLQLFIKQSEIKMMSKSSRLQSFSVGKWLGNNIFLKKLPVQFNNLQTFVYYIDIVAKLNSLRHPNILQYFGLCVYPQEQKRCGYVTQYISRGSLQTLILDNFILPRNKLLLILRGICQGMIYLHQKGIIHSNLKPSNILIDQSYVPKLNDFKLSQFEPLNTQLNWTSPQVLRGKSPHKKSDVYSFGMIILHLLTKKKPFEQYSNVQIKGILGFDQGFQLPIQTSGQDQLFDMVRRCTYKQIQRRPSFQNLLTEIERLIVKSQCQLKQKCKVNMISLANSQPGEVRWHLHHILKSVQIY